MATQDAAKVYRIKARLVLNPTDLTQAFPHGGTVLGYTAVQVLTWGQKTRVVRAEEWGKSIERHESYFQPLLSLLLLQPDYDALSLVFPGFSQGSGYQRFDSHGYGPRGNLPATNELLLSPLNTKAKGFLIRRPLLFLDPAAETVFSGLEDATYALVAEPTPTATGDVWEHVELAGGSL